MHTKKDWSFTALRKMLSRRFLEIADFRQEAKVKHVVHDVLMSGFTIDVLPRQFVVTISGKASRGDS